MAVIEDVRPLGEGLERSYQVYVRGRLKFRVKQIVYVAFSSDESGSGITAPFNAPSQGPPPWGVYRIAPRSAIVTLSKDPGGLTRFRF